MIDYIGDISWQDAYLFERLAKSSTDILEFGAGASTQIFATSGAGSLVTVETDPEWVKRTEKNLKRWTLHRRVIFINYDQFENFVGGEFDLILVDGKDQLRLPFAHASWPYLRVGGVMLFHDTRREHPHGGSKTTDIQNVLSLVEKYFHSIETVEVNAERSHTTVVKRCPVLRDEDWNVVEKRTHLQRGYL